MTAFLHQALGSAVGLIRGNKKSIERGKDMKQFKRILALTLGTLLTLSLFGCGGTTQTPAPSSGSQGNDNPSSASEVDSRTYHIATGALGAYNYTLYAGVSDLIDKEYPGKYTISLDAATGSTEMARLVTMGDADFGTSSLDDIIDCYNGVNDFEGLPSGKLRFLYNTGGSGPTCHVVLPPNSTVESVADLAGKKIGVTVGYMDKYMRYMLAGAGLNDGDYEVSYLAIADICNGIKDGTLDAGFYSTPHPLSSFTDLAVTSGMKLLNVGDELVDQLIEDYPFFHKVVVPGGTYQGNDEDVVTFTAYTCWVCNDSVPEDTVYEWLSVILADSDRLAAIHPNAANIKLDTALLDRNIPLHPGALKYYQEHNMIQTDELADLKPTN